MSPARRQTSFAFLMLMVLALAVSAVGCPCVRNAVNADAGLRWWLFSNFGASKVCPEMLKRGVPLKVAMIGPNSVGRFFPSQCQVHVNDQERTMVVDVTGEGYVVLPFTRRVGFYCGVSVEYRPDFKLEEDSMYVWGRYTRATRAPDLRLLGVENQVINLATQTQWGGDLATVLGRGVLESEIAKGFTVVRLEDGDDFTLGILTPPERPKRYFKGIGDHVVLESNVTDLATASRDYLGPFTIEQNNAALYARLRVAGAPADYILVDRQTGDAWRRDYEAARPMAPNAGPTIAYGQAAAGEMTRAFPVEPGSYYLVIENRAPAAVGLLGMPMPFEARSTVTYSVESSAR
ncbi:hypothetical protein LVJ94_16445 [Pendulispora rubella]|uniref:Uncharacterized protein n=1 Tax=Pendulispora rubella TaxID=2741070 RepID=A0ABZ2LI29_9BACT